MEGLSEFVKGQVKDFMYAKDLDIKSLARELGVTESKLRNEISPNGDVGYTVLESLFNRYPNLSVEWLFRGEGKMEKENNEEVVSETTELECFRNMSKQLENISESLNAIVNKRK